MIVHIPRYCSIKPVASSDKLLSSIITLYTWSWIQSCPESADSLRHESKHVSSRLATTNSDKEAVLAHNFDIDSYVSFYITLPLVH